MTIGPSGPQFASEAWTNYARALDAHNGLAVHYFILWWDICEEILEQRSNASAYPRTS